MRSVATDEEISKASIFPVHEKCSVPPVARVVWRVTSDKVTLRANVTLLAVVTPSFIPLS